MTMIILIYNTEIKGKVVCSLCTVQFLNEEGNVNDIHV